MKKVIVALLGALVLMPASAAEVTLTEDEIKFLKQILLKDKLLKELPKAQSDLAALNKVLSWTTPGPLKLVFKWNQGAIAGWRKANDALARIGKISICQEIDGKIVEPTKNVEFFEQLAIARGCDDLPVALTQPARPVLKAAVVPPRSTATVIQYASTSTAPLTVYSRQFGSACTAILSTGLIYDRSSFMSSRNRLEQFYNFACKSSYSSSNEFKSAAANLGIPLEGLPVPLDLGVNLEGQAFQQKQEQWCTEARSRMTDASTKTLFEEKVNQGMIGAFGKCIDAEKETILGAYGAFATATPNNRNLDSFLVTLEFRPLASGKPNEINGINPADVRCFDGSSEVIASRKKPYVVPENKVSFNCLKNGATATSLAFNTVSTASTPPIVLPGTVDDATVRETQFLLGSLASSIQAQRAEQAETRRLLTALTESLRSQHGEVVGERATGGDPHDFAPQNCPAGSYVSGFAPTGRIQGKYGDGALLAFKVVCTRVGAR